MQWIEKEYETCTRVVTGLVLEVPFLVGVVVGYVIKYYVGC